MRAAGRAHAGLVHVVLTALVAFWMRYTARAARYAVGGNAEAARLSGLAPARVLIDTLFLSDGFFTGIAAVMFATQFTAIQASSADLELSIITASVVGGVRILGGMGTVWARHWQRSCSRHGSALIFVNISPYWLRAVLGVLILLTVLADVSPPARQAWRPVTPHGHRRLRRRTRLACRALLRHEAVLFIILVAGILLLPLTDRFLTPENLLDQGRSPGRDRARGPADDLISSPGGSTSGWLHHGPVGHRARRAVAEWGLPLELAIVVALGVGALAGLFNARSSPASGCRR